MFVNALIETEDLVIRPYKIEDIDALYEAVSTPDFYKYIPEEVPTHEDVANIVKWSVDCCRKNTQDKIYKFNLAIIYKHNHKLIGFCGLGPSDIDSSEIEIYYGMDERYRGKGLTTQAAKAVMKYGFETIALNRIVTIVHPDNLPSLKILEKLGMKFKYALDVMPAGFEEFTGQHYYSIERLEYESQI